MEQINMHLLIGGHAVEPAVSAACLLPFSELRPLESLDPPCDEPLMDGLKCYC